MRVRGSCSLPIDREKPPIVDKAEWRGTDIVFEMARSAGKTEVRFTHLGLVPAFECFTDCYNAWGFYINASRRNRIATGKAAPK